MAPRPLLLFLLLLPFQQGCKPMLYPVALAFGSPTEGELAKRRVAFDHLKASCASARVLAYPLIDPSGQAPALPDTATFMAELLRARGWEHSMAASVAPGVAPTPLLRNQLRFVQTRAEAYAAWAKTLRADADFLVVVEALPGRDGSIRGVHCFVLEASGQVAYMRFLNSHSFGPEAPQAIKAACRLAVRTLLKDLQRPTIEVHPPYGVG